MEFASESSGPYLATAVLCEKVLRESDGVVSLIRIVDRIVVSTSGPVPELPAQWAVQSELTLFVAFKPGAALGKEQVVIQIERPDGIRSTLANLPVVFEGEDRGAQALLALNAVPLHQEGLYWFHIRLGEQFVTKASLRLTILHQQTGLPV